AGETQIVAGAGNDAIYVGKIGGETAVLGGAGDDFVYAGYDGNNLDMLQDFTFDGDGHLSEQLLEIPLTDPLFDELQSYGPTGADLADEVGGKFWVRTAQLDGNNEIMYGDELVFDDAGRQLFWNVVLNTVTTESTLTLDFGGESTGEILWQASAADLQAALNALGTIVTEGGVTVSGGQAFATTDVNGTPLRQEVQEIHWGGYYSNFQLAFDDGVSGFYSTPSLPFWATAQMVEDALNAMPSIDAVGGVSVDAIEAQVTTEGQGHAWQLNFVDVSGGDFTLTLDGDDTASISWSSDPAAMAASMRSALQDVAPAGTTVSVVHLANDVYELRTSSDLTLAVDAGNLDGGSPEAQLVDAGLLEVQRVHLEEGGSQLSFVYGGNWTWSVAWDATAAEVENMLDWLVPGGVTVVEDAASDDFLIYFDGGFDAEELIGFNQGYDGRSWQVTFDTDGPQNQLQGWLVDVRTLTEGQANEVQRLYAQDSAGNPPAMGEQLYFTFEGEPVALQVGWDALQVESALNALASIQARGGVVVALNGSDVAGSEDNPWVVTFANSTDDVEQISGARQVSFNDGQAHAALGVNPFTFGAQEEQQLVLANVSGGSFTLTHGTVTTADIAWSANNT
ncbi:MAG: hypothetical protein WA174_13990, partial [Rhodoferax sp.]